MARSHPTTASSEHTPATASSSSSPALLHAAWITAAVAVCVALCTIHARKPSSRRRASRSASSHRCGSRESSHRGVGGATPAAKVSPTPSDTAKAANGGAAETDGGGGPVTVIDVGTHGPIAPAFLPPPPDPLPPRRSLSLSAKHIRFAERIGRIRSMRRGGSSGEAGAGAGAAEDDVFVGCRRGVGCGGEVGEEGTLWTKTIILGERCRVPSDGDDDDGEDADGGGGMVRWRSYRPRQPRSVPVTRSNSFAGVGSAGARRLADPRF
ncbi:unnamed protein product [Urochloa decumbens]|uniref:Uncharacterized protein n=1 Tax=Urochloa decumbens TaxID=240449 RepID=A0ABC9ADR4_9POAL